MSETSKLRSTFKVAPSNVLKGTLLDKLSEPEREFSEAQKWRDYFLDADRVLSGEGRTLQINNTSVHKAEVPSMVVTSEYGEIDIAPMLRPGFRVIRKRPDGDVVYHVREFPIEKPYGSQRGTWRLPLVTPEGGPYSIDVSDLAYSVSDFERGRSWQLDAAGAAREISTDLV